MINSRCLKPLALLVTLNVAVLLSPTASSQTPATVVGPRNAALASGAQALLAGDAENGVRLTLEGLSLAQGGREEEAALSNLCTGYLRLRQFPEALKYCDMLLERNPNAWRAYNSRAMIYLELKEYEKADQDLRRAEAINPGAHTLEVARAQYMETVHPVAPAIEIDDSDSRGDSQGDR